MAADIDRTRRIDGGSGLTNEHPKDFVNGYNADDPDYDKQDCPSQSSSVPRTFWPGLLKLLRRGSKQT